MKIKLSALILECFVPNICVDGTRPVFINIIECGMRPGMKESARFRKKVPE